LQLEGVYSPPTTIYVTTLPCEILIASRDFIHVHLYQTVNLLLWW